MMHTFFDSKVWLAALLAAVVSLPIGAVFAHEGRSVGEYRFTVGWMVEPAYEGLMNGVELRAAKVAEEDGHGVEGDDGGESGEHDGDADHEQGDDSAMSSMDSAGSQTPAGTGAVPVEGLEETLQVEIVHPATGASKVVDLRAVAGEPGRYTADVIPTAPGVYEFRVFGTVEGAQIDETFVSRGAGGDFDDIRSSKTLQFPEQLPETRELESAVRGALETARQAHEAALSSSGAGPGWLAVAAVVAGGVGAVTGAAGLATALRRRRA